VLFRTITAVLPSTTCLLVTTVSAATKNPLPRPSPVSTVTTAGIVWVTSSSIVGSGASASSNFGGAGGGSLSMPAGTVRTAAARVGGAVAAAVAAGAALTA
jgi:hypothetical protein